MNKVQQEWKNLRIAYQRRYIAHLKDYEDTTIANNARYVALGHVHECSYVLLNVFGLTTKQIKELEENYCGFTHDDLDNPER